jgi:hypothetical protein
LLLFLRSYHLTARAISHRAFSPSSSTRRAIMSSANSKELGVETMAFENEEGINMTGTHASGKSVGTVHDQQDMRVMGKLQELRVRDAMG